MGDVATLVVLTDVGRLALILSEGDSGLHKMEKSGWALVDIY